MDSRMRRLLVMSLLLPGCSGVEPTLESRIGAGRSAYVRGDYDSAEAVFNTVLEDGVAAGDPVAQSDALTWLGNLARREGDYEQAREAGEEALAIKIEHGLDSTLARSHNSLGLLAWWEGRLLDAEEHYRQARNVAERMGQTTELAVVEGNQGLLDLDFGRFEEARVAFQRFAELSAAMDSLRYQANALTNLAMWAVASGRALEAFEPGERALEIFEALDTPSGAQSALAHLADAHRAVGRPGEALEMLERATVLARTLGERPQEALNLEARARVYWDVGETGRALDLFGEAEALYAEMGQPVELGTVLRSMAEIHLYLEEAPLASRLAERALELHREAGDRYEEFFDRLLLGEIARTQGRRDRAAEILESAESVQAEEGSSSTRYALAISRATLAVDGRDPEAARRALLPVVMEAEVADASVRADAYRLRAASFGLEARWDSAADWARRSTDELDRVRTATGSASAMTTFTARRTETYADLVDYLIGDGRIGEAFLVADRMRGRTILREVALFDPAILATDDALGGLYEADALERRIAVQTEWLADPEPWLDDASLIAMAATRASGAARLEAMRDTALASSRGRVSLLGAADTRLADIQGAMGPDETLVEYLVADSVTTAFVVTAKDLIVVRSDVTRQDLTDRVRIAREIVADPQAPADRSLPVLEALYEILWSPVAAAFHREVSARVIVVPHAFLQYLPFAALRNPDTGRYLLEDHRLLTLPTASALPALRSRMAARTRRPTTVSLFAPRDEALPFTRDEIRAIAGLYPGAREYVGDDATESAFRRAFASSSIVHVATHGALNPGHPLFSRIELAPGDGGGVGADGALEVHEVLSMRGQTDLVFLSGCETGVGPAGSNRFAPGDDLATLAQAFLYAGAPNVLATLWAIQDASAARFTSWFYEGLRSHPPEVALRDAQQRALEDPSMSSPYHWASYVLAGSGGR